MTCEHVRMPGGGVAIVCGPKRRARLCSICHVHLADKLCDHPKPSGGTCDAAICVDCAAHVEPDTDYCRKHAQRARQSELGL